MRQTDDIIINQRIVIFFDWNHNITACICRGIWHISQQDTRNSLLQHIIGFFLKICIDGQVNVLTRNRIFLFCYFQNTSQTVDIQFLRTFRPLQLGFKIGFHTGLANLIIKRIAVISLLFILSQFIFGNRSDIPCNVRKIFAVLINTCITLFHRYTRQILSIFFDCSHQLIIDIISHCDRQIFLITFHPEIKADRKNLQCLFLWIGFVQIEQFLSSHIRINILSGRIRLFIRQFLWTINVLFESQNGILTCIKTQRSWSVHFKWNIIIQCVACWFNKTDQLGNHRISRLIICQQCAVLYRDSIRQLVVRQRHPVAIINGASRALYFCVLLNTISKRIQIIFAIDDLKLKQTVNKNSQQYRINNAQDKCSCFNKTQYIFQQIFKQWDSHFLFSLSALLSVI